MKVGITGWRGFIGSHLLEWIENPILYQYDMRELEIVQNFVSKCDRIYHVAGANRAIIGGIVENNLRATGNLMAAMITEGVSPEVVFLSSTQVEWNPKSEYGATKAIEENIIKMADKWCIYRIPNVYGPGCKPFYNSVVATFAYQIARGEKVTMNNPELTREFIFIDDLVNQLVRPEFNEYVRPIGETMSIQDINDYLTIRLGEHEKLAKTFDFYKSQINAS